MNESILTLLASLAFGFVIGVVACVIYALTSDDEEPTAKKPENLPLVYTAEEITLAQFLKDRQAINEAFLSAQAGLLKEFRK